LTPSEKKSPEGTAAHRKAAAATAIDTVRRATPSTPLGPDEWRVREGTEGTEDTGDTGYTPSLDDFEDHMEWAKKNFPGPDGEGLFGAERIESVAAGPENFWTDEEKAQVHGWRNELGPNYELVEVTDDGEVIYEGPDGDQVSAPEMVDLEEGAKSPTWRDQ
jgi:hypothetical protein